MPDNRYSVCKLDSDLFTELKEMNKTTTKELLTYLNYHTAFVIYMSMADRFRYLDDAKSFAEGVYTKNNSGDAVAIFDRLNKSWIECWFL
ncbi:MAG: hypothetical protein IJZ79_02890 [Bacilli bacterium]|nr:hypothetical protein [Bacilli bacterium]MBQ8218672.1 hypothetical protein [Bacilli bacterium]